MRRKELTVLSGIALLTLIASLAPAWAQGATSGNGQIRGEVTDPGGRPLVGISIVLSPAGRPDIVYVTSTDDAGRFAFNGLVPENYVVQAHGQGVRPLTKEGILVKPPFRAITALEMERIRDGSEAALAAATGARAADHPGAPPTSGPVFGNQAAKATQSLSAGGAGTSSMNQPLAMSFVSEGDIGRLHGRFVDAQGHAVEEGSITLRRLGVEKDVFYSRTDRNGNFEMKNIPAGLYDISTRSPGLIPLHLREQKLPSQDTLFLSLVAPDYPLEFRGFLDDLLPAETPQPPPSPRVVELAGDAVPVGTPEVPADDAGLGTDDPAAADPGDGAQPSATPEPAAGAEPAPSEPAAPAPATPADPTSGSSEPT